MAFHADEARKRILEESSMVAQEAARVAGTTFTPGFELTGGQLTPVPPMSLTTPSPLPPTGVANIPITEPAKIEEAEPKPDLIKTIEGITAQISGFEKEPKIAAGTVETRRELNELNKRIRLHQAEALEAEEEARERGETLEFASGEAARVRRNSAIEALRLSALAQAKQGDVALATDLSERAVDAEFAKLKRDADVARQNMVNNYASFTPEEKRRADAALLRLDKQDAFVKQQEDIRSANLKTANKAAGNQAPNEILDQISKAATEEEGLRIAAPYLREEPKVIGSAETGYFQFNPKTGQYDIPITLPGGGKKLSILDVGRYNDLYPEAGITPDDTEATARAKIAALQTPEGKIKALIVADKNAGRTYEDMLKEIEKDASILDKEMAKRIAAEVYGIKPEEPKQPPTTTAPIKPPTAQPPRPSPLAGIGTNLPGENVINTISGFLFGK